MKIAIDASRLTRLNRTGTENYLYFLLSEISKLDTTNNYVLYFREEPSELLLKKITSNNPNFSHSVLKTYGSWTQLSLAFKILATKPDILFCPWHTMPILSVFLKTKVIATIHDLTGKVLPTQFTINMAHALIAVSKATSKLLGKKSEHKTRVIYEGFDSSNFYPREELEISEVKQKYQINGRYLFFLGSISDRKNIKNMIEAYKGIKTDVDFVFGGAALPGFEYLTKLSAHFIGRVDQKNLPALYTGAEFFAFVSEEEGFGIPVLESMACGTPVLTSDRSSLKEIAEGAALLSDPKSIDDISTNMQKLLTDSNLRRQLSEKGLKHCKKFSWENAARETLEFMKEVSDEK